MCLGLDGAQAQSGGQWQALLMYPGKLAIGTTFELAADQQRRVSCFDDFQLPMSMSEEELDQSLWQAQELRGCRDGKETKSWTSIRRTQA